MSSFSIAGVNRNNFDVEQLETKAIEIGTLTARAVSWFKGENDTESVRMWKRIGAIALAVLLALSLIGIPFLTVGIYDWQKRDACKIEPQTAGTQEDEVTLNNRGKDEVLQDASQKDRVQYSTEEDDLYGLNSEDYQTDPSVQEWITQEEMRSDWDVFNSFCGHSLQDSSEEIKKEPLSDAVVSNTSLNHVDHINHMLSIWFPPEKDETQEFEEYDWSYLETSNELPDPITSLQTLDLSDQKITKPPILPDLLQNNFSKTVKMGKHPVAFPHDWYHFV